MSQAVTLDVPAGGSGCGRQLGRSPLIRGLPPPSVAAERVRSESDVSYCHSFLGGQELNS